MFKNLRYDRANDYSPEIVIGERYFAALIGLGDRNNIAIYLNPCFCSPKFSSRPETKP